MAIVGPGSIPGSDEKFLHVIVAAGSVIYCWNKGRPNAGRDYISFHDNVSADLLCRPSKDSAGECAREYMASAVPSKNGRRSRCRRLHTT